uniref:Uncharacterized protein n=1 Tax=Clytia hemisphaerica TaxID=252671 RepID=A0A7M5V5U0_9CNID
MENDGGNQKIEGAEKVDGRPGKKNSKSSNTGNKENDNILKAVRESTDPDSYPNKLPGYFLLINNENFLEMDKRTGTDIDARSITVLFQDMGFTIEEHKDLLSYKMRQVLQEAGERSYAKYSCLIICILSHGKEGEIYAVDETIPVKEITLCFHGSNLAGKPKIFLLQACQGRAFMNSVQPREILASNRPPEDNDEPPPEDRNSEDLSEKLSSKEESSRIITLPSEADFLYAYSTAFGFRSFRGPKSGTWFIQSFCEIVRKQALTMDVIRILTRVNLMICSKQSKTKRQVVSVVTQLRKEFFLPIHLQKTAADSIKC